MTSAAAALFSPPPHVSVLRRHPSPSPFVSEFPSRHRSSLGLRLCSSSPPLPGPTSQLQEDSAGQGDAVPVDESSGPPPPSLRGCQACGREEMESGCNGEGRIQGGIATVPGFGWWPIKAYRPCPGFVESGGRYRRRGQSMDEVVSGRSGKAASSSAFASEAGGKGQGP